jgi:hypothetical protein
MKAVRLEGERSLVNTLFSGKKTAAARPAEDAATKKLGGGRGRVWGANKSLRKMGTGAAYKLR